MRMYKLLHVLSLCINSRNNNGKQVLNAKELAFVYNGDGYIYAEGNWGKLCRKN